MDGAFLPDRAEVTPCDLLALNDQAQYGRARLRFDALCYGGVRIGRAHVDRHGRTLEILGKDLVHCHHAGSKCRCTEWALHAYAACGARTRLVGARVKTIHGMGCRDSRNDKWRRVRSRAGGVASPPDRAVPGLDSGPTSPDVTPCVARNAGNSDNRFRTVMDSVREYAVRRASTKPPMPFADVQVALSAPSICDVGDAMDRSMLCTRVPHEKVSSEPVERGHCEHASTARSTCALLPELLTRVARGEARIGVYHGNGETTTFVLVN